MPQKILGWGECTATHTPTSGSAETYDDVVENSGALSVEEGAEQEANVEGGKVEGRKKAPDKYIIEFDRRLGSINEFTPGYIEDAGTIAIVPKNVGAVYAELQGCSLHKSLKQDSTNGLVGHYKFKTKGSTDSNGDLDDVDIKQHSSADTYSAVADTTGKNPYEEGWYIKNGTTYIHSYDTTPQSGVTYYTLG